MLEQPRDAPLRGDSSPLPNSAIVPPLEGESGDGFPGRLNLEKAGTRILWRTHGMGAATLGVRSQGGTAWSTAVVMVKRWVGGASSGFSSPVTVNADGVYGPIDLAGADTLEAEVTTAEGSAHLAWFELVATAPR